MNVIRVLLSVGLIILGLVGVGAHVTLWMSWLVFALGVVGLLGSGFAFSRTELGRPASGTLGIAALVLWILALATRVVPWLTWWTFAIGVAFVVTAFVSGEELAVQRPA